MSMIIEKFIELAEIHAAIDYGNAVSVKKGNAAADAMNVMALEFVEANRTDELLSLLTHTTAGSWVAFSIADLPGVSTAHKEKCISRIQSIADGSSLDSTGAQYWLKERGYVYS